MRRGQAEIMGLIILVVILVVALLIYLRLSSNGGSAIEDLYSERQFGQSFVTTLLRTEVRHSSCGQSRHETGVLLRAVAEGSPGPCAQAAAAKSAVESLLSSQLLPGTLDKWDLSYRLLFLAPDGTELFLFTDAGEQCTAHSERRPAGSQFIPTGQGEAELRLEICD